jgi:hypothetical protein
MSGLLDPSEQRDALTASVDFEVLRAETDMGGPHATLAPAGRNPHLGQCVRHTDSNTGFYVGVTRRSAGR